MKSWGLGDDTNAANNLKMTPTDQDEAENKVELDRQAARTFRGMAARVNYMGQDRSDVHFAAREICTEMSKPTVGGMVRLKRMARYLAGAEKVIWKLGAWEENEEVKIEVYVDSDWAKAEYRRSVSGGMVALGRVGVKHWSRTQSTRALSSGEAEYAALVTGCAEGLGIHGADEGPGHRRRSESMERQLSRPSDSWTKRAW